MSETYVVPLKVTNNCGETLWPGIATQHGVGPGTGGFVLDPGRTVGFNVSWDWQGRLWGRTNCSFNDDGSGPANLNGVDGNGAACTTGDCFGKLDCEFTGATPCTLAEFNLWGGVEGRQTFYDISLVDGYNLPLGVVYLPAPNTSFIPPNLVNAACIATRGGYLAEPPRRSGTVYGNSSFPVPWESRVRDADVARWCPWDLQSRPPTKPGDGVFPYPDDDIERPVFDPCRSACAAHGRPEDCCTGAYADADRCTPSLYSRAAKRVCPDAYSFAFDDQTSTFIIPSGGGWEVVFCPRGRSTNILRTFGDQLRALAASGAVSRDALARELGNLTYIEEHSTSGGTATAAPVSVARVVGLAVVLGLLLLTW
ncbi:uncharacterized protein E0L32_003194 [Thyridium curvatum]|uniref:Thaumatin-like protein n=1 Tax=Thyridium curvatum TaxID=1093900 RepID=A0A507BCU2_9PEZI|nr:uncharacterized protein E0L32_003194 [Thyridium curvatum]TPX17076.1 hypothetical protein E0L32_003194 [Thyridium curvatum]